MAGSPRNSPRSESKPVRPASLKELADHLGLAPATVSLVMNGSPVAQTIAKDTKGRIFAAAKKLGYRPNFMARCLRARRSFTIGVMIPEVSEGYNATVLSGIRVAEHGLVGSMGVASKDVPPFHVVGGVPAKTIKVKSIAPEGTQER